jgi:hypothetical protein
MPGTLFMEVGGGWTWMRVEGSPKEQQRAAESSKSAQCQGRVKQGRFVIGALWCWFVSSLYWYWYWYWYWYLVFGIGVDIHNTVAIEIEMAVIAAHFRRPGHQIWGYFRGLFE